MLGKLMKYEWRGMRIPLIVMLCVLIGTSLLTCFSFSFISTVTSTSDDELINALSISIIILSVMLYYFGIIVCTVGIMLIVAMRFYKTCYTDQGYLTHTLPVSTGQLLASKLITAVLSYLLIILCVAISVLAVVLSIGAFITDESWGYVFHQIGEVFSETVEYYRSNYDQSLVAYIAFWIISLIFICACSIINIFGCISLGQLYAKHRIIGAILAYFVLKTAQQIFSRIGTTIMFLTTDYDSSLWSYSSVSLLDFSTPIAIIALILNIAVSGGLCYASYHMMTKRLNLE